MALENLKDIFEQAGFGSGAPMSDPTPPEEQSPNINKIEQLYKPDSKIASKITFGNPVTTDYKLGTGIFNNPDVYDDNKIKQRTFDTTKIGQDNNLGLGDFVLETLYNKNHTANTNRIQIQYGQTLINTGRAGMGSLDNLNIKGYSDGFRIGTLATPEPYIISEIGSDRYKSSNRDFIALNRAIDDTSRLLTFYGSGAGLSFIAKENITNFAVGKIDFFNPLSPTMAPPLANPIQGNTGFLNVTNDAFQDLGNTIGSLRKPLVIEYSSRANLSLPFAVLGDTTIGVEEISKIEISPKFGKTVQRGLEKLRDGVVRKLEKAAQKPVLGKDRTTFIDLKGGPRPTEYVDYLNRRTPTISDGGEEAVIKPGDFVVKIKDLRGEGRFIYFRGFVTGITENVSPNWSTQNYIGRSEPVYMYERAERDLSFNLRVYPNNQTEFEVMYEKLEALTSLAYPNYFEDGGLNRMQPPFTELYMAHIGEIKQGKFGFIKSISYTVPGEGDWDALTARPRLFDIALSYQILSKKPPQMGDEFYKTGEDKLGSSILPTGASAGTGLF